MRHHKGKSFLAPPRLFKSDRALYFPNMYGQTLIKNSKPMDTTPVLMDRVSIVSVFSGEWAYNQCLTFSPTKDRNPELKELIEGNKDVAQWVRINVEENAMKAWLINLFMGNLRRVVGKSDEGRYFLVKKGLEDDIRDAIGLLNSKVGYTYLIDGEGRIRWAGSGPAEADEKDGLLKGMRRLIEDARTNGPKKGPAGSK
jgi:ATPase complex subunit ATP10